MRVSVIEEGEDDKDVSVDGVDVPEVVEASVMDGRNLPLGPLL